MRFVFKFGGSSLSSVEKIQKVATYIKEIKNRGDVELIVVVSAMGKTTNKLVALASKISNDTYSKEYSSLISCGENISASALALALEEQGVDAISLSAKDIQIHAKGSSSNSIITHIEKQKIEHLLECDKVVVVTGFQGVDNDQRIVTLGRGGSDTTATALGVVFNASVKIFTDVKGVFTINPTINSNAKKLNEINIYSALESSSNGAKVLDNRCLEIANKYKQDLEVCESLSNEGTKITYQSLEDFHIDTIATKINLLFVKYTYKTIDYLQILKQNTSFKVYFNTFEKQKRQTIECFLTNASKSQLLALISNKNKANLQSIPCESVVLCGSGLSFYPNLIKKVQNIIKINHIYSYFLNLQATALTILVKPNQSIKLANALAEELNLLKEN